MEMQLYSILTLVFITYEMQVMATPNLVHTRPTASDLFSMSWTSFIPILYSIWSIIGLFTIYRPYYIALLVLSFITFVAKKLLPLNEDRITRFDALISVIILVAMFIKMLAL